MNNNNVIVALTNPKYQHNVGAAIRACSCWEIKKLIWSGKRCPHPEEWKNDVELQQYRMPREERMKGYKDVELIKCERFKDIIDADKTLIPVAIELVENAEDLFDFEHPDNAMYIFGPEDGSIPSTIRQHCHRFVKIPTAHCLNLACAINVILSHRATQIYQKTGYKTSLKEIRG